MATLNGAEFKIIEIEWATYQNNVVQEILGSDTVEVQNQGHGSEPVKIKARVNNEKEMDDFQEQFYSGGILTFIKDPNSGRQYSIYALGNVRRENISNILSGTGIIFTCVVQLRYPYNESIDTITRSKSITTQNQEWSSDDDSVDIKTDGNVDAVPDIRVTGGKSTTNVTEVTGEIVNPSFENALGGEWVYSEVDTHGLISGARAYLIGMGAPQSDYGYQFIRLTGTAPPSGDYGKIKQTNVDLTDADEFTLTCNTFGTGGYGGAYLRVYIDSDLVADIYALEPGLGGWYDISIDVTKYIGNHDISLVMHFIAGTGTYEYRMQWDNLRLWYIKPTKNVKVFNKDDSTIICEVSNDILGTAIHRINSDGTGSIEFYDDFTTDKWGYTNEALSGISRDTINNELDIADDGYIYWKKDTKFPINGTPTLTSRINITSGTPTIQISSDASTWYDIDTSIIDDTETEYPLDSDGNLSLAGKTVFYWRIDCVKASAATCSIKYFELDINIHTIYAKNPKIDKGSSANTFRIDQDSDSGMACTVDLIFKNRWWI